MHAEVMDVPSMYISSKMPPALHGTVVIEKDDNKKKIHGELVETEQKAKSNVLGEARTHDLQMAQTDVWIISISI